MHFSIVFRKYENLQTPLNIWKSNEFPYDFQIDGKLLCWLCTLSYKRALAKARQVTSSRMTKKRPSTDKPPAKESSSAHKKPRPEITKPPLPEIPEKVAKNAGPVDSSEHVVAIQLKEQIASLQKRLVMKDRELLSKDKHITELKSLNFISENELRTKMKDSEKFYDTKIDVLNKKVAGLLKEVAQLSKGAKKNNSNNAITVAAKDSGGSGTDSPQS